MAGQKNKVQLFEGAHVRAVWDEADGKWWFSIVDVVKILTDSPEPRKYWSVLKTRLKKEGSELTTNCSQLKMEAADGKKYLTDVADTGQILRLIQSIPSKKAEPFKLWLAEVAATDISIERQPVGLGESAEVAKEGAKAARAARDQIEKSTGKPVVSKMNAKHRHPQIAE